MMIVNYLILIKLCQNIIYYWNIKTFNLLLYHLISWLWNYYLILSYIRTLKINQLYCFKWISQNPIVDTSDTQHQIWLKSYAKFEQNIESPGKLVQLALLYRMQRTRSSTNIIIQQINITQKPWIILSAAMWTNQSSKRDSRKNNQPRG